jgi:hypothetical protein
MPEFRTVLVFSIAALITGFVLGIVTATPAH